MPESTRPPGLVPHPPSPATPADGVHGGAGPDAAGAPGSDRGNPSGNAPDADTASPAPALDSGLLGLVMLARFDGLAADPDQIAHDFQEAGWPFAAPQILLAAKALGLRARCVRADIARLERTPLPALARAVDGRFFIVARADAEQVLIQDPGATRPQILAIADFAARWSGELILFASRASLAGELARFDFTWFLPAVVKYRKLLGEVLLVSFVLQLFALVTPLFFQVVMDKVLVHRGLTTLDVIAGGLLVVVVFESALSGLRTYVFAHTTSRIDVELGARLFRHLLNLPLAYFQARRVGDTVARVRELENIRQFLTGNAITLVLDLVFSVVFIAVMLAYSGWLTLVVVVSLPLYLGLSLAITPLLRARLHEKFNRGAENQAFLVETINGIDTLKAMAVEPQMTRRWENQQAAYVSAGFRTATLGTAAHEPGHSARRYWLPRGGGAVKRPMAEATAFDPERRAGCFPHGLEGSRGFPQRRAATKKDEVPDPSQYRLVWDGLASRDGASTGWGRFRVRGPLVGRDALIARPHRALVAGLRKENA